MLLVTGASGHVGANLLRELLRQQEKVRVLIRSGTAATPFHGLDVQLVEADVRDVEGVRRAVRGCHRIYHCAAKVVTLRGEQRELYDINVLGTRNVLGAAKKEGVQRVVVTSSLGAVGHPENRPCNEDDAFYPFDHHLPYEESKAWAEHECLKACAQGLDVVMAVSTAVLGPYDFGPSRMGRVIRDFANGKLGAYIPGGFEFVGAGDLARGHVLAMQRGQPGQRYIFSSEFLTVDELMGHLERITGMRRPRLRLPPALMRVLAHISTFIMQRVAPRAPLRFTPDAVRLLQLHRRADVSKARRELGYAPTPIEGALRAAYAWFAEQGQVQRPADAVPPKISVAEAVPESVSRRAS
jgi:nucleoside-diphosphate-sugar epimerase